MSEGDGADVHVLYPDKDAADEAAPVHPSERPESWCSHRKVRLDDEKHRVFCRDCGREVDPYDVLLHLAHDWSIWVSARKEAERRAKVASDNLRELLRLEANAKARKKRRDARTPG